MYFLTIAPVAISHVPRFELSQTKACPINSPPPIPVIAYLPSLSSSFTNTKLTFHATISALAMFSSVPINKIPKVVSFQSVLNLFPSLLSQITASH